MKTNFLILILFLFPTVVFSQDIIVSFTEIGTKKALKTGQYEIEVDNSEKLRKLTVPAKTQLGVINYFKAQGYDVEVKIGMRSLNGMGVSVWYLFCTKKKESI